MSIIVFLGPSLEDTLAQAILPDAHFFPPAACGDVVKVLSLAPKVIVLIDGFFESRPAVWHKEILYALSQGIEVYGAASMGALRAAELADFGMIGCGEIYTRYRRGSLIDDDEVALMHWPKAGGFKPLTLPMVNIRFTVEKASEIGLIDAFTRDALLQLAKEIFYQERTLAAFKAKAGASLNAASFFAWLERGGYVDQKKADALQVLKDVAQPQPKKQPAIHFSNTAFFRNLKIESLSKPFDFEYPCLPMDEKIAVRAQTLASESEYLLTKALAKAIGIAHDCGFVNISTHNLAFTRPVDQVLADTFLGYFKDFSTTVAMSEIQITSLKMLAKILATLYGTLNLECDFKNMQPASIFEATQQFYVKHKIETQQEFRQWLQQKKMTLPDFKAALRLFYFYDFFVCKGNLLTLYPSQSTENKSYFITALLLNKLAQKTAKSLL